MAPKLMSRSMARASVGILLVVGGLAVLRPWTVRPLRTTAPPAFDAVTYAEHAWPRILEEATRTAVDAAVVRQRVADGAGTAAPSRRSLFVRVTGTLVGIDRDSRVGVARVRVPGGTAIEVAIQVGPVLRGTALRDAASFIRFTDFANQSDFAAVSNALHVRVLRDVIPATTLDSLVGTTVTVVGATALPAEAPAGVPIDIVPVAWRSIGGPR
jgi:predicted lipoprotein